MIVPVCALAYMAWLILRGATVNGVRLINRFRDELIGRQLMRRTIER